MKKSLLLGTLLGGLVAFVWSSVSWEIIGWHEKSMLTFQNDDEVSAVISSHAPQDGVYILPGMSTEGMAAEQKKKAQADTMEKMQKGPIMFAAVRRNGFGSYARTLIIQFFSLLAAAFLLTWMLLQTSGLSYARRVAFLAVAGLAASVIVDLPNWNWWGFSGTFTAVNLADSTITWLLAGLVIAKVAKSRTT
jgi:lipoprotein signal peptidase